MIAPFKATPFKIGTWNTAPLYHGPSITEGRWATIRALCRMRPKPQTRIQPLGFPLQGNMLLLIKQINIICMEHDPLKFLCDGPIITSVSDRYCFQKNLRTDPSLVAGVAFNIPILVFTMLGCQTKR